MHGAIAEEFRDRIIDIVCVIPSVKRGHNKLVIANPSPFNFRANDTLITGRVKTALAQIPGFDASWVKVVTEKSTVYLMGLVHRNEGAAAIDTARHHKFAWSNKHLPKGCMAGIAMHESNVNQIITIFEYLD